MKFADIFAALVDGIELLWKKHTFLFGLIAGVVLSLSSWGIVTFDFWMMGFGFVILVVGIYYAYRTGKPK